MMKRENLTLICLVSQIIYNFPQSSRDIFAIIAIDAYVYKNDTEEEVSAGSEESDQFDDGEDEEEMVNGVTSDPRWH